MPLLIYKHVIVIKLYYDKVDLFNDNNSMVSDWILTAERGIYFSHLKAPLIIMAYIILIENTVRSQITVN